MDDDWFGEGANDAPEEEGEDAEEKKRQLEAYMKGFGGYSSNPFLK